MLADTRLPDFTPHPQTTQTQLPCALRWRQGRLWVRAVVRGQDMPLPALASPDWFQACLGKSKATAVCIDPSLGTEVISLWAQACLEANKPLYLRIPAIPHRPSSKKPVAWTFKCICDRAVAATLLALLTPLVLLIGGAIKLQDGGPVFATQWRVGERGRLFRVFKFRTAVVDERRYDPNAGIQPPQFVSPLTRVGQWLKASHLDKLPLFLNVLRGEMSLVGPHAWAIYETLLLPSTLRGRLHTLPGLTGTLQTFAYFPLANPKLRALALDDLQDLNQWSLWKDVKRLANAAVQVLG